MEAQRQRQRQEEEARRAAVASVVEAGVAAAGTKDSDNALLKMTIGQQGFSRCGLSDLSSMTEKEQIAHTMQMSLQGAGFGQAEAADIDASSAMDTSEPAKVRASDDSLPLSGPKAPRAQSRSPGGLARRPSQARGWARRGAGGANTDVRLSGQSLPGRWGTRAQRPQVSRFPVIFLPRRCERSGQVSRMSSSQESEKRV